MQSYEVKLHMYDISMGMAKQFSPALLGRTIEAVWHTGIVVYNREYYFGGGISGDFPAATPFGQPSKVLSLGKTEIPYPLFMEFLKELEPRYTEETYHVFKHNCNNFTNECANFLLGKNIPEEIINLPQEFLSTPLGKMIEPFMTQMQDGLKQKSNPIFNNTPGSAPPAPPTQPPSAPTYAPPPPAPSMPAGAPPGGMPSMPNIPPGLMNNLPAGWQSMAQQFLQGGGLGGLGGMGGGAGSSAPPPEPLKPKHVVDITTPAQLQEYKKSYKGLAIDFWSPTCGPCLRIKPEFEKLAEKFKDIKFLAVNTSTAPTLAMAFQVQAVPSFYFYLRGQVFTNFKGANSKLLEQTIFQMQDKLDAEKKVLSSFKVFNPYKKQAILFTANSSLKVILSKVKDLAKQVGSVQSWLKDGVEMNEALMKSVPLAAIQGLSSLFAETPIEDTIALFDLFRLIALEEDKLKYILNECWGSLEVVFVMMCEQVEGIPTGKQMNAMLVALRFLCNIFSHSCGEFIQISGQQFFNEENIDGLFFFLNGVIEKAGQKSPKVVNACAAYLYNLRLFYSGNENALNDAGKLLIFLVQNTLKSLFTLLPKMNEVEEGLLFSLCAYAHRSKELTLKYKSQLSEAAVYVKTNAKPGTPLVKAADDLLAIVGSQ